MTYLALTVLNKGKIQSNSWLKFIMTRADTKQKVTKIHT